MSDQPGSNLPLAVCAGLIAVGIAVAALGGLGTAAVIGGLIAGGGAVPAAYAAWQGMQHKTQGRLALALAGLLGALGVGGVLILAGVVGWFR